MAAWTASLAMSLAKRLSMSSSFVAPLLRHAMVKMDGTQRSASAARLVSRDAEGVRVMSRWCLVSGAPRTEVREVRLAPPRGVFGWNARVKRRRMAGEEPGVMYRGGRT